MHQSPFSVTPWVRGLIIANAVVFLLSITIFTGPWFLGAFAFSPDRAVTHWWTFATYMFLHGGFLHLAFNMLMLFFFGPAVEDRMGGPTFGLYYFVCGLGGAVFSFAVSAFTIVSPFVGASAAVFGVSLAFVMHWPNAPVYIFPLPVPIKAKWLVIFLATVSLVAAVSGAQDGVAHLAHIGGFLFGFIYLKGEERVVRRARAATVRPRPPRPKAPARAREVKEVKAEQAFGAQRRAVPDEVNLLLDKINATGLESLTPDERRLLENASRHLREP